MGIIVLQRINFLKTKAVWYDYFLDIPTIVILSFFTTIATLVHFGIWEKINDYTVFLLIIPFIGGLIRNILAFKHGDLKQKEDIAKRYKKAGGILLGGTGLIGLLILIDYLVELTRN